MKALAGIATMLIGSGLVIFSDVYLRAGDRDGVNGLDAHSYDVTGTILLMVGLVLTIYSVIPEKWFILLAQVVTVLFLVSGVVAVFR